MSRVQYPEMSGLLALHQELDSTLALLPQDEFRLELLEFADRLMDSGRSEMAHEVVLRVRARLEECSPQEIDHYHYSHARAMYETRRWDHPSGSRMFYVVLLMGVPRIKINYASQVGVVHVTGA